MTSNANDSARNFAGLPYLERGPSPSSHAEEGIVEVAWIENLHYLYIYLISAVKVQNKVKQQDYAFPMPEYHLGAVATHSSIHRIDRPKSPHSTSGSSKAHIHDVWAMFSAEAEMHDRNLVEGWQRSMDVLLIFVS